MIFVGTAGVPLMSPEVGGAGLLAHLNQIAHEAGGTSSR